MTATVTSLSDFRAIREAEAAAKPTNPALAPITRTPELALIMALYDQLPRKYVGLALCKVMQMAERLPDCEASQEAGRIAALLALTRGVK